MLNVIPLPYKIIAAVLALVLLFGGTYWKGYSSGRAIAAEEIQDFKDKSAKIIADLERKNAQVKERIVTQYVDRVRVVKQQEVVYRDRAIASVPQQAVMSNGWIYLHDASATSAEANVENSSDAKPSGVTDTQALAAIVSNYSRCNANANQLESLQSWIKQMQENTK